MTNDEFILENRLLNTKELALKKCPDGVDLKFCLQQIEGWQTAWLIFAAYALVVAVAFVVLFREKGKASY